MKTHIKDKNQSAHRWLEIYDWMFHCCGLALSEEKRALQRVDSYALGLDTEFNKSGYDFDDYHKDMEMLRQALNTLMTLRTLYGEDINKQLAAFEIIKAKEVNLTALQSYVKQKDDLNYKQILSLYNKNQVHDKKKKLTLEDLNLLVETLKYAEE